MDSRSNDSRSNTGCLFGLLVWLMATAISMSQQTQNLQEARGDIKRLEMRLEVLEARVRGR